MGCLDHLATGCVKYLSNTWPFHEHCAGDRTTETEMAVHHSLYHGEQERPSPIYVSVAYAYGRPQSPAAWEQGPRKVASTPDESELSVYDSQVPAEGLFSSQVLQMRFHAASQQECLQGDGWEFSEQISSVVYADKFLSLSSMAQAFQLQQVGDGSVSLAQWEFLCSDHVPAKF